ncbi:MAG: hypothetical protein RID18_13520 [Cytophagales bacterium]
MKKLRKKIKVTLEKTRMGYSAYAEDLNVFTTAPHVDLLTKNLVEAINLYYEDKGCFVDHDNLSLHLDIPQFFGFYRVLNAKYLARRIGMNPVLLSQYVTGRKVPSHRQAMKIVEGIHNIGKELSGLKLE